MRPHLPLFHIIFRRHLSLWLALTGVVSGLPMLFASGVDDPLALEFQRLAARRYVFSKNIVLAEFVPAEVANFASMHPPLAVSSDAKPRPDTLFRPRLDSGKLFLENESTESCFLVGAVSPYATYDLDVVALQSAPSSTAEIGIDLARHGLRERVQLLAIAGKNDTGVVARVYDDAKITRELRFSNTLPEVPFKLRLQLSGRTLAAFVEKEGVTTYLGHFDDDRRLAKNGTASKTTPPHFGEKLDFRNRAIAKTSSFNIVSRGRGTIATSGARSFLSIGMGQADIRPVSYEDLTPLIEDGRLWFTLTCRGIGLAHPSQGVISLDPSTFDLRFEGMVVFDFDDGLLRNAVASHLFYDRTAQEWRAYSCDFGGSKNREGRSQSHLLLARSTKDPRRGFSVMQASLIPNSKLPGHHEDPCIFHDVEAGRWRLLTSSFVNGNIVARLFESDAWDGTFTEIATPLTRNSTGTAIQKIGGQFYCFMGGAGENLRVHAYPDLRHLGELKMDFQPHWPSPAARIWACVVPLPEGFPHRYVLLTMDRENFPGVPAPTWSYGALYFYGANP